MKRSEPWPFVTVAVPCLDEADHIEAFLEGVAAQDYPMERLEVMVADGGSRDGTRERLDEAAKRHSWLKVVDNPDRLQAPGLNRVLRESRGEIIVRMDVHCRYAPEYVTRCIEVLERTGADNVGGAQRPIAETPFQKAVCAALQSPLGVGGARYRSAENEGYVDTVFLGAFRRRVFETAGLYDPGAFTNEDAELNQRILQGGGRIYLSRAIEVYYYPRDGWRSLARQYFRYGRGRARTLLKHRAIRTWRPVLPFLGLILALCVLVVPNLRPWAIPGATVYGVAALVEGIRWASSQGLRAVLQTALLFPLLHVAHGSGFVAGLGEYAARPDWVPPERLAGHVPAP